MSNLGGSPIAGSSALFAGPLGVVKVGFKGYDLGKTTGNTSLTPDQDIKDIIYQQDGTKAADKVRTGLTYKLSCTLGEISTGLLKLLMAGISSANESASEDFGVVGRSVYQSMRDQEAGVLKIAACDANGVPSEALEDQFCFYEAFANVSGALVDWGADTQRNLPVEFTIVYHEFETGESTAHVGAFGYWGDPDDSDLPAITWPDTAAPVVVSAAATAATTLAITFDEAITEVNDAYTEDMIVASVDGVFVAPTASAAVGSVLTLTFPAATFSAGDVILLNMSAGVVKDAASNENEVVTARAVTNSVA